jgi:hypothetical protein
MPFRTPPGSDLAAPCVQHPYLRFFYKQRERQRERERERERERFVIGPAVTHTLAGKEGLLVRGQPTGMRTAFFIIGTIVINTVINTHTRR